jgi:hypothetical protein
MGNINRGRARKAKLREDAAERKEARAELSSKQQLALLDKRFGAGEGAKKERARLAQES